MSWNLTWKWGECVAKKAKKRDDRLPTIPNRRRNPQDATMRNVRSANYRLAKLNLTLESQLVPMLHRLERRIAELERYREISEQFIKER